MVTDFDPFDLNPFYRRLLRWLRYRSQEIGFICENLRNLRLKIPDPEVLPRKDAKGASHFPARRPLGGVAALEPRESVAAVGHAVAPLQRGYVSEECICLCGLRDLR